MIRFAWLTLLAIVAAQAGHAASPVSAEAVVEQQVRAYNNRDLESFLATYSEDVKLYDSPGQLSLSGKLALRARYRQLFTSFASLHCQILDRIVFGDTVVLLERITRKLAGAAQATVADYLLIYTVADAKIIRVDVQSRQDGPEAIALVGAEVIDGTGAAPRRDWTVLIQGERIIGAGPHLTIPKRARIIDAKGKTILPGLIDMHGHLFASFGGTVQNVFDAYPALYLAGGVTTVRSPADFDPEGTYQLKQQIATDQRIGPRLFIGGPYLQGEKLTQHRWMKHSRTPEQIVGLIEAWQGRVDLVKFYTNVTEGQMRAGMEAARRAGLPAAAHLGRAADSVTASRAIDLGVGSLEHGIQAMPELYAHLSPSVPRRLCDADLDSPQAQALIDKIIERRVAIDPTLGVMMLLGARPDAVPAIPGWQEYFADARVAAGVEREMQSFLERNQGEQSACAVRGREQAMRFVKRIHEGGGVILAGTDPFYPNPYLLPGWALHAELKYLTDAGLTPLAAIKAATSEAARVLGRAEEIGSIAVGQLADLIVVAGSPALRIEDIGKIEMVFKGGEQLDPRALRESAKRKITVGPTQTR